MTESYADSAHSDSEPFADGSSPDIELWPSPEHQDIDPAIERDRAEARERLVSRAVWTIGTLVLLAAIILSLMFDYQDRKRGELTADGGQSTAEESAVIAAPSGLLPTDVAAYEVMVAQEVPGSPNMYEAVYTPYDLKILSHFPLRVYAVAEAFRSPDEARAGMEIAMRDHTRKGATVLPAPGGMGEVAGALSDSPGSWKAAWVKDNAVITVKAFFDRAYPNEGDDILARQGAYVARCIAIFQRTGKQGAAGVQELQRLGYNLPMENKDLKRIETRGGVQ